MNSIRPLVTISILTAVGIFLYVKINEAPLRPMSHVEAAKSGAVEGAPPLELKADAGTEAPVATPSTSASLAPQWPGTSGEKAGRSDTKQPQMPAIPELPELTKGPAIAATESSASRTGGESMADALPDPPNGATGNPRLELGPSADAAAAKPASTTSSTAESEHDSAAESAMAAMGLAPAAAEGTARPSPGGTGSTAADRYGLGAMSSSSSAATTTDSINPAVGPSPAAMPASLRSFAADWPTIQAALQKGELARAHQMLSPWHGDSSLAPAEAQQVDSLLSQLAGTVIYSTEHRLEPPYVVRPGETLETIAQQHGVPWQLLAKINGVPSPEQVRPGQQLKVVRGPFEAVINLRRNQLALRVDGRYAGKFAVVAPPDVAVPPGDWIVEDKPATPAPQASVYGAAAGSAVSRSLVLRSASASATNPGMPLRIVGETPNASRVGEANGLRAADGGAGYMVKVSPADVEELSDILSIGSRVVIQR
jgi:LysM repeat protein